MFLDESVFGRKCFWTKVFLDEFFFFSNLDESVPNHQKMPMAKSSILPRTIHGPDGIPKMVKLVFFEETEATAR